MRRPAWCRAFLAVWGFWLAIVLSEPAALHSCPLHGAHAAGVVSEHAGHAAPASDATNHSHHSPTQCTCLGQCCCAAPIAIVGAAALSVPDTIVTTTDVRPLDVSPLASQRAYAHPFANGPPHARSLTLS